MELKNAILQTISCMLSIDSDIRRLAEERQTALEVTDDYGIHLAEILLTSDEALEERQMAGVLLKRYVNSHWSNLQSLFVEPQVKDITKDKLRKVLPIGLAEESPKLQHSVANVIAVIAEHDFPDKWPEMVDVIMLNLKSSSCNQTVGTLEFISECCKTFPESKLAAMGPPLYDTLYSIIGHTGYPTNTRSLALYSASKLLYANFEVNKINQHDIVNIIAKFINLAANVLVQPHSRQSDFCLKHQIMVFFLFMYEKIPQIVMPMLENTVPMMWQILSKCSMEYVKVVMDIQPHPVDFVEYDTLEAFNYTHLVEGLFELLEYMLLVPSCKKFCKQSLSEMFYSVMIFMSVTSQLQSEWSEPETYYTEEIEESMWLSLRSQARYFLIMLIKKCSTTDDHLLSSVEIAMRRLLVEYNGAEPQTHTHWWRAHECIMLTVGTVVSLYPNEPQFNLSPHITFWMNFLDMRFVDLHVFLFTRALWIGGKLTKYLEEEQFIVHINTILQSMASQNSIVRIAAIRALVLHCSEMDHRHRNFKVFVDRLENILEQLISVTSQLTYILEDMLKCFKSLSKIEHPSIRFILEKIIVYLSSIFPCHVANQKTMFQINLILTELTKNSICVQYLQEIMLNKIICTANGELEVVQNVDTLDVKRTCLNALQTLVDNAPQPLNENLVQDGFMMMYKIVFANQDCSLLEAAANCTISYVMKSANQLYEVVHDNSRPNGADCVINIIRYMLAPKLHEETCKPIGKLTIVTLKYMSGVLHANHLDVLIKSALTRLNYIQNVYIEDSLIIIFAYLFNAHTERVVTTLSLIPGPDGDSALAYVLTRWLNCGYMYHGKYERNLCTVALGKILEYAVLNNDNTLSNINIKMEYSITSQNGEQLTIPLLTKIFQILVKLLVFSLKNDVEAVTYSSDEEDAEEVDSDNSSLSQIYYALQENKTEKYEFDEEIYNLNIVSYLADYMTKFSQTSYFYTLLNYISDFEKENLKSFGIQIQ